MEPFEFRRAQSAADATAQAEVPHSRIIAGGTALLDLMKLGVERPTRLIDINQLPLDRIELRDGGLQIGALVRKQRPGPPSGGDDRVPGAGAGHLVGSFAAAAQHGDGRRQPLAAHSLLLLSRWQLTV